MDKEQNIGGENDQPINSEIEIDIRDIICYCFLRWRSALVIMMVFGLLFGGYSTFKNYRSEKALVDAYARYDTAVSKGVKDDDKLKVAVANDAVYTNIKVQNKITQLDSQIAELNEDISKKEAYLRDAEIMKINPNKEYLSKTVIAITAPDTAKSGTLSSIMDAYKSNLLSQKCKDKINSETGIDSRYINDLIDISASTDYKTDTDQTGIIGTLIITAIGKNESDVKSMTSSVLNNLEDVNRETTEIFGEYSTRVMDTNYGTSVDEIIAKKKDDINKQIIADRTSLSQSEATRATLTVSPRPTINTSVLAKGLIKKGAATGTVIFLLYGFLLCILYVMGNGAITKAQFKTRYKLFEMGAFADACDKIYRRNGAFDKWLRKRMSISEKSDDRSTVCDMIATNLNIYASDMKNIIITGSATMEDKVKLISELCSRNQEIAFLPCESLSNNFEDRKKLKNADGAIFFEKYGVSRYSDLNQEVMLVSSAGVTIIGYVTE